MSVDKLNVLRQKIVENENLKSQKVITDFNELMKKNNFKEIVMKDFEKVETEEIDDLPF